MNQGLDTKPIRLWYTLLKTIPKEGIHMDVQTAGSASAAQLQIQYQAKVLSMQKNAMKAAGEKVLQLLQAATVVDPAQGQHLNVTA